MSEPTPNPDRVNLTIDGISVTVPKGTNLIEAARVAHTEIPHYCYHPDLSVVGNCRMCQVEVEGRPKLEIACNTAAMEGMVVRTHLSSQRVVDAQAATLEFILINHPLDCTVCDQAGHCKLQDYHYEYNARPSRFVENKVHKPKAKPLGPNVILDAERCILCTRCIRFCDEITKTSELGMANRGDQSEIIVNPGKLLDNPLSGCVVDLCPVGALTHIPWRFNTRIWFTREVDSICPGCSTGCNVKAAVRDEQIVQVKGRYNKEVNREWLCDEGRYGFHRFLPKERLNGPYVDGKAADWDAAMQRAAGIKGKAPVVFLSPDLTLEEYAIIKSFLDREAKGAMTAVAYRERPLTEVEALLISPDYASNFRGAEYLGLSNGDHTANYEAALHKVRAGSSDCVFIIGERGVLPGDIDEAFIRGLGKASLSMAILHDPRSALAGAVQVVMPGRSILEKSGLLMNRARRVQYASALTEFPGGTEPEWRIVNRIAAKCGKAVTAAVNDRDLTLAFLKDRPEFQGVKIQSIKPHGIPLNGTGSGRNPEHLGANP